MISLRLLIVGLTCLPLCACATTLTSPPAVIERLDDQTILFKGVIGLGDDLRFAALLTPQVRRVVVNSGGGEVTAGIRIGKLIAQHGLDVEVDSMCGSSCANYLFTAGKQKIVPRGAFVGFHGDPRNSWAIHVYRFLHQFNPAARRYAEEAERLTDEFYALTGVNPRLFAYSAQFTTANQVTFWLPSPQELACMNVRNLDMWFSEDSRQFSNPAQVRIRTSAEDIRVPRPNICQAGN